MAHVQKYNISCTIPYFVLYIAHNIKLNFYQAMDQSINKKFRGCCIEVNEKLLPSEKLYHVKVTICQKKFEWIVTIEFDNDNLCDSIVDITPILSSFIGLNYDPYHNPNSILLQVIPQYQQGFFDIDAIVSSLVDDLLNFQASAIESISNRWQVLYITKI